jgi:hypothetical protein
MKGVLGPQPVKPRFVPHYGALDLAYVRRHWPHEQMLELINVSVGIGNLRYEGGMRLPLISLDLCLGYQPWDVVGRHPLRHLLLLLLLLEQSFLHCLFLGLAGLLFFFLLELELFYLLSEGLPFLIFSSFLLLFSLLLLFLLPLRVLPLLLLLLLCLPGAFLLPEELRPPLLLLQLRLFPLTRQLSLRLPQPFFLLADSGLFLGQLLAHLLLLLLLLLLSDK